MKRFQMFRKNPESKEISEKQIQRRNFISFGVFAAANAFAFGLWNWLFHHPAEHAGTTAGTRGVLRNILNKNEEIFRKFFNDAHLVRTYPKSMAAKIVRQNGDIGMTKNFDWKTWKLKVERKSDTPLLLSLKELKKLPKTEIVFDFKCVEGWDQISHWGGVKFRDLVEHYGLWEELKHAYVGMSTADGQYYVGLDMESAMHPQTLLCYEMNGKLLPWKNGYPLRLIIPVKYGIKNIKRISSVVFSNERPPDYWAQRGYDYFAGL